jgi:hypothetical protein
VLHRLSTVLLEDEILSLLDLRVTRCWRGRRHDGCYDWQGDIVCESWGGGRKLDVLGESMMRSLARTVLERGAVFTDASFGGVLGSLYSSGAQWAALQSAVPLLRGKSARSVQWKRPTEIWPNQPHQVFGQASIQQGCEALGYLVAALQRWSAGGSTRPRELIVTAGANDRPDQEPLCPARPTN